MAFYDVAGGMRFANIPGMVQAGIRDGRTLREIALYNQHGQGIMNGDAAAMAELARFDPATATTISNQHAARANAAASRAAAAQKATLEQGLQMATILGRAGDEEQFNRTAAWLADNGMPQARNLIGKYAEAAPMFSALTAPQNNAKVEELKQIVASLPPDQQQQAFNLGLTRLATGLAMEAGPDGRLAQVNKQETPGLRISTDANGNPVVEYGPSEEYTENLDKKQGQNDATHVEEVMSEGARAAQTLARLDLAERAFKLLPNSGKPFGEIINDTTQAFLPVEQQRAIAFAKNYSVESAMAYVQQTKGAVTDREMTLFMDAAAGMRNTVEGNLLIIQMQRKVAERASQQASFYAEAQAKGVSVKDARAEWNRYITANPIFDVNDFFPTEGGPGGDGLDDFFNGGN